MGNIQVDRLPELRKEGEIRLQQSSEYQSNNGGWGGGRMQDVWEKSMIHKMVDKGGAGKT